MKTNALMIVLAGVLCFSCGDSETAGSSGSVQPIPITPGDASSCSATLGPNGERPNWPSISSAGGVVASVPSPPASAPCTAPGWVFCINAVCADQPTVDADMYNGKPFVKCSCWQPTNTDFSLVPLGPDSGANCALGQDTFAGGKGGEEMCQAIRDGALISTYGPEGTLRGGTPISDADAPFSLEAAECRPNTPWAWCWGAPCERDEASPTGITCHCPYMTSTNNIPQPISLAGKSECEGDPCTGSLHNSMPAGQSPNSTTPCAVQSGA